METFLFCQAPPFLSCVLSLFKSLFLSSSSPFCFSFFDFTPDGGSYWGRLGGGWRGKVCARNWGFEGALWRAQTGVFCCYPLDNMKTRWSYSVATYAFVLVYKTWGRRTGTKSTFLFKLSASVSRVVFVSACAVYKCVGMWRRLQFVKPQEWVCFSLSKCSATNQFPLLLFASLACVLTFLFWTPSQGCW